MSDPVRHVYVFGPFELDVLARRLTRGGEPVALTPKSLDVLFVLVEHRGRLLEKSELMRRLWPDTFVEEANLTQHIFTLRKQLGEQPGGGPYIETVPRRGYRFVGEVQQVQGPSLVELPGAGPKSPRRHATIRIAVVLLLLVMIVAGMVWLSSRRATAPPDSPDAKVLAILPFRPLEQGPTDEYLALGMADAIITRLARIQGLVVRPTSSVLKYAAGPVDPLAAARELSVDSLVDGRFQRLHDRIRVTVQLLAARDGSPIWAGTFDEPFKDVFTVQDRISERVAEALVATLTEEERARLRRRFTGNTEAYQLYLRGRYFWERRTDESLRKSVEYYRQAIGLDPTYALAYAGMADSYLIMGNFSTLAPADAFPKAKAAAQKALDIDASLTQARVTLAFVTYLYDRNWDEAERGFLHALREAPDYGPGHQWYAVSLTSRGRFDEAVAKIERAQQVDPLSLVFSAVQAWVLYLARRYDEAVEQARRTIDMDAGFPLPHYYLGLIHIARGRHADAVDQLKKSSAMYGAHGRDKDLGALGFALARAGRIAEARVLLNDLQRPVRDRYVSPYAAAVVYLGLEDRGQALALLERAADERFPWATHYNVDPLLDELRPDPRFKALLRRIGIPEVSLPPRS